jgi:hypothetical protein
MKVREVKNLRTLEGRQEVFEKYWKLFFQRSMKPASGTLASRVADMQLERIVQRRRSTDWQPEPNPVIVAPASEEVDVDDLDMEDAIEAIGSGPVSKTSSK